MRRVVITGVGAISSLGCTVEAIADRLYRGRSGVGIDPERQRLGFRSPLTGVIDGFDPEGVLGRKERKSMTLHAIQSYAAALQAVVQSGLEPAALHNPETGLIFGCDSSSQAAYEQGRHLCERRDTSGLGSGQIFRSMTSNVTMNLNVLFKTQGACWTISSACSSSGHAVGQAADLIRCGKQQRMICGGAQEINWESVCSFDALEAFSRRTDVPASASRPFSHDRDGLVPSGGAAALVLEEYDLARQRGARILGEIAGYGFSSDGHHISQPHAGGSRRAMVMALAEANCRPGEIDYISAHATATPAGDAVEATAIGDLFGDRRTAVSSVKSMAGHELWMAGAAQVVYTTIMAMRGFIAPNINFSGPDEASARLAIVTETLERPPRRALCNSAGFGGTNASLVIHYGL